MYRLSNGLVERFKIGRATGNPQCVKGILTLEDLGGLIAIAKRRVFGKGRFDPGPRIGQKRSARKGGRLALGGNRRVNSFARKPEEQLGCPFGIRGAFRNNPDPTGDAQEGNLDRSPFLPLDPPLFVNVIDGLRTGQFDQTDFDSVGFARQRRFGAGRPGQWPLPFSPPRINAGYPWASR